MLRGIVNLDELNRKLVVQDDELRERCIKAATLPSTETWELRMESMMAALLDAQLAIHERLGNLIITNMSNGGS